MNEESLPYLYLALVCLFGVIVSFAYLVVTKNEKNFYIILDATMLIGYYIVSFVLFKGRDFPLKYPFLFAVIVLLIFDIYNMVMGQRDKNLIEEDIWKKEAFK